MQSVSRVVLYSIQILPPPRSTLFPYTTLFRSGESRTHRAPVRCGARRGSRKPLGWLPQQHHSLTRPFGDRKSTRLNSSHQIISYAVFCLKKKRTALYNSESVSSAHSIYYTKHV